MEHNICKLPAILLGQVLMKVDKTDIDNLCLTNSLYYSCICQNKKLWQSLVKLKFGITTMDNPKDNYFEYSKSLYGYAYNSYSKQVGNHTLQKLRSYVRAVSISPSYVLFVTFITSENVLYYTSQPFDQQLPSLEIAHNVKKVVCDRDNILFLDFNQNLYVVEYHRTPQQIMRNVSDLIRNNSNLSIRMKDGQYLFYGTRQQTTVNHQKVKWANIDFISAERMNTEITKLKTEILQNVVDEDILPRLQVIYFKYLRKNYTYTIKECAAVEGKVSVLTLDNKLFDVRMSNNKLKSVKLIDSVSLVEYYGDFSKYYYVVNDHSLHINHKMYFDFDSKIIKLCAFYDSLYILLSNGQVYLYGDVDPQMAIVGVFTDPKLTQPLLLLEGIVDLDVSLGMQLLIAQDMPKIMV